MGHTFQCSPLVSVNSCLESFVPAKNIVTTVQQALLTKEKSRYFGKEEIVYLNLYTNGKNFSLHGGEDYLCLAFSQIVLHQHPD